MAVGSVRRGRVYSTYSKNIIIGDPMPLKHLQESIGAGRADRVMQRVALDLQALDLTFEYRPRAEMQDVDTLNHLVHETKASEAQLREFLAEKPMTQQQVLTVAVARPGRPTRRMLDRGASEVAMALVARSNKETPGGGV